MRNYYLAPFLCLATSLSAQVRVQVLSEPAPTDAYAAAQLQATPTETYDAALSLLTDWGFPILLSSERNGVIVTATLAIEQGGKLVQKPAGFWLDCGKDWGFSRAASADYIDFQFIVLIVGDSSASTVEVNLFTSAVEAGVDPPTCSSRNRLEPFFIYSLRARFAEAP